MATTLRDIGFRLGYDLDKASEKKVEDSINSLKSFATKALGAIGIGFSLAQINAIAEEFNGINDKINYAVKGLKDQKLAQQDILKAANDTKTSYAGMASTVSQLVQVNSNLFPVDDAVEFASLTQKLLISAGKSESEASSIQSTIAKTFQTGKVTSGVLRQLYNQAPEVLNTVAAKLGTTTDKLYDLADAGVLTGQTIKDAIVGSADEINEAFNGLDYSISDALLNMRNSWGYFIDDLNSTFHVTQTIAKAIVKVSNTFLEYANKMKNRLEQLADKLGGTEKLLKLLAVVAGAVFLALNGNKILSFLKAAGGLLNGAKLKMLAIVAVIVLIALLIEDFIAFMKGENSFIGEMFAKAGIDADEFRQSCKDLWEQVKDIIGVVKEFGKALGRQLLDALRQIIPLFGKLIASLLPVLLELAKKIVSAIARLAEAVLPMILDFIGQLVPFLVEIIEQILPVILDLIEALLPLVMQIIESVLPLIISLIKSLLPLIMQIVETVLPIIVDLIKMLVPFLVQIVEAILPVAIKLIETLIPFLTEIIEAILPVVIELIEAILPPLMQIIEAVLPIIIQLVETLLPLITQIIESILPVILQLIEAILPVLTQIIETILPVVLELISAILPVLQPIIELVGNLVSALLPPVVSLLNAILPILKPILAILEPIADILGVIIGAIAKVVGWIASGLGWVVDLIFGGGGDTSGADKVNAYAKGTESSSDTFVAGEEGPELVTGAPGKKVFTALETGNIMNTLRQAANLLFNAGDTPDGEQQGLGSVISGQFGRVLSAMQMLGASAQVQPSTVATNTSSRTINQYNNFQSTFNGDRAGQTKSAAAMSAASDDAVGQMARALAFAR